MFVFKGKLKAVLTTHPSKEDKVRIGYALLGHLSESSIQ